MAVTNTGVWQQEEADAYHQHSNNLANFLAEYLPKDKPVYDFGCGVAFYLHHLQKNGFACMGVEGFALNNFMHEQIVIADLTNPISVAKKGSVICLECIEHIPKEFEQTVLDTITNACDKHLIFSWALPNQGGVGHVNLVPQEYAIAEVERRGFKYLPDVTKQVRGNIEDNTSWFRTTLMIFERI